MMAGPHFTSWRVGRGVSLTRLFADMIFWVLQWVVPIGQYLLPLFPESLSRRMLAGALRRWPSLWGMLEDSKRVRATRHAYRLAFPNENADAFTAKWIVSRGEDLAMSLIHMARVGAGRRSSL